MLVRDQDVHAAFDWLEANRSASAAAKALKLRAEYNVKKARAQAFLAATGNNAEREAQAILSEGYQAAVEEEIECVEADEFHRNQRNRCAALIEAWRTEQSNMRSMGKVA